MHDLTLFVILSTGIQNGLRGVPYNINRPMEPDYISAAEIDLTREIDFSFSELKHSPVGVNYDLVELVETLFMPSAVPVAQVVQKAQKKSVEKKAEKEKAGKAVAPTKKGARADKAAMKAASITRMVNEVDEVFSGFRIADKPVAQQQGKGDKGETKQHHNYNRSSGAKKGRN